MAEKTVIVGAGVSGLTLAERLVSLGTGEVLLIEREDTVGGLARTFEKEGFLFDIGPHRFHTSDPDVRSYLLEVLGHDHITIERCSNVYMAGRYRSWPLSLGSVLGLPPGILFRSFLDLFRRRGKDIATFADYVISRYGRNIYDFFFRDYTSKFTGRNAEELHVDWAEAGVNRAVIDKNVKADDLLSLLRGILLPKAVSTSFYYPSSGGIQTFCRLQSQRIIAGGGRIMTGCSATGIVTEKDRVTGVRTSEEDVIYADRIYWSAPLSILFPDAGFQFMNTLLCNIGFSRPQNNEYQWCYFGQKDIVFSRLTVPRFFRADMVPPDHDSLTAEITVGKRDMEDPAGTYGERLLCDLERVSALERSDVLFMDWKTVPETYPLYDLDYRNRLDKLKLPKGLDLVGRCGSFWYNNMDHSIGEALAITGGGDYTRDFWKN